MRRIVGLFLISIIVLCSGRVRAQDERRESGEFLALERSLDDLKDMLQRRSAGDIRSPYRSYQKALENLLRKSEVQFTWEAVDSLNLPAENSRKEISTFALISPIGQHPMNLQAAQVARDFGGRIVFDPIIQYLKYPMARALYDAKAKAAYTGMTVLRYQEFQMIDLGTTYHESLHGYYEAARARTLDFNLHHPIHIVIKHGGWHVYAEELLVHAKTLEYIAEHNPSKAGEFSPQAREQAQYELSMLKKYLGQIETVATDFLNFKKKLTWKTERYSNTDFRSFELGNGNLIAFFIPTEHENAAKKDPRAYLHGRAQDLLTVVNAIQERMKTLDINNLNANTAKSFTVDVFNVIDRKLHGKTINAPLRSCSSLFSN